MIVGKRRASMRRLSSRSSSGLPDAAARPAARGWRLRSARQVDPAAALHVELEPPLEAVGLASGWGAGSTWRRSPPGTAPGRSGSGPRLSGPCGIYISRILRYRAMSGSDADDQPATSASQAPPKQQSCGSSPSASFPSPVPSEHVGDQFCHQLVARPRGDGGLDHRAEPDALVDRRRLAADHQRRDRRCRRGRRAARAPWPGSSSGRPSSHVGTRSTSGSTSTTATVPGASPIGSASTSTRAS